MGERNNPLVLDLLKPEQLLHSAMVKRNETHQGTWKSYKWKAKEFLINSSGCQDLRLKHRQNSLFQILSHTTQHQAIDEKFNFYSSIDLSGWYNKDNSFI